MVGNITATGIDQATAIDLYEDAVQKAGNEYFAGVVQTAEEWMGMEPEARKQVEAMVKKAHYRTPADAGVEVAEAPVARQPMRTMARSAAPQGDKTDAVLHRLRGKLMKASHRR